jgi:hypothetical protein
MIRKIAEIAKVRFGFIGFEVFELAYVCGDLRLCMLLANEVL